MERRADQSQEEVALERLLQRVDAAIDEYRGVRHLRRAAPTVFEDAVADPGDPSWEAWWSLPLATRDWLLWYVPGWWALAPGIFRRFLLATAGLIVWNGLAPRIALQRAAAQLRLSPRSHRARIRTPVRPTSPQSRVVLLRRPRTRAVQQHQRRAQTLRPLAHRNASAIRRRQVRLQHRGMGRGRFR